MSPSPSSFQPVSLDTLRDLTSVSCRPCISIYGRASLIPSLLAEANYRLVHSVSLPSEASPVTGTVPSVQDDLATELLAPLRSIVRRTSLRDHTSVALFASPDVTWAVDVPVTIRAGLAIGEAFALGPLLSLFSQNCVYAVRLSPANPAVVRVTDSAVEPLDASILTEPDWARTTVPLFPPALANSTAGAGGAVETVHDPTGPAPSDSRARLEDPFQYRVRWLSRVDRFLAEVLPRPTHPLFLAGSAEMCSLFESLHPHRLVVPGRVDDVDDQAVLGNAARRASQTFAMDQRRDAMIQFYELQAYDPDRALCCASDIAAAARSRRVETLFVDEALSEFQPPPYHSGDGAPRRAFGGEAPATPSPVTSRTVEHTIAHTVIGGGTFFPVHGTVLPPGHRMAALLRY